MGLKSLLNKFSPVTFKKSDQSTRTISMDDLMDSLRLGRPRLVTETGAYEAYNFNSVVSDAVEKIAGKVKNLTPIIVNGDGSIETVHPVLEFLKNPNKLQNQRSFLETMATNYLLHKNSYIEVIGNVKFRPIEMYPLKNTWVSLSEGENTVRYQVSSTGLFFFLRATLHLSIDTGRIISDDGFRELTHTKGFSQSLGHLKAVSILSSIERDIRIVDQAGNHNLSLLEKGFNGNLLINVDTDDKEAFETLKKDFKNKFQGSGNAGSPLISRGKDIEAKTFGQTNKDMEYSKSRKMSQETGYQRFEIPKPIIDGSHQTFDNYGTAKVALYDDAIFPMFEMAVEPVTEIFRRRGILRPDQAITYDPSNIPATQIRRTEELKSLRAAFILSLNELRAKAGKEEVPGGDVILVPSNLLPAATDQNTDDNRKQAPKEFVDILSKNDFSREEINEYWNDYQTAFRPNKKG